MEILKCVQNCNITVCALKKTTIRHLSPLPYKVGSKFWQLSHEVNSPTDKEKSDITIPHNKLVLHQCKRQVSAHACRAIAFLTKHVTAAKSIWYSKAPPCLFGYWSCDLHISLIFRLFCRFLLTPFFFFFRVISRLFSRPQQPTNIIIFLCKLHFPFPD